MRGTILKNYKQTKMQELLTISTMTAVVKATENWIEKIPVEDSKCRMFYIQDGCD